MAKYKSSMTPPLFRAWRKGLKLKQKEAAFALGLKPRMIQYYEKGERDGKKLDIPKSISLACWAISQGILDFDGEITSGLPENQDLPKSIKKTKKSAGK